MAQRADSSSSSASRATRRQGRGVSSLCEQHLVGKETGLPLIVCPDCDLARVIELRVVKLESQNKGRIFFKYPRNGNPKLCGFYRFQREYLDELVEKKIVRICNQIDEHGGKEDEAPGENEGMKQNDGMKQLENKMERLM
ncbi:uncharacterized protein LOC120705065 [Panicum virgatum]|uniref:uncharacterized protein LOC120705065 n=1 Tax=Panicum virgatum TaxID=38727 RepID=UPI0019D58D2E|nr:uncharacterized protein LOC120705065 [Panicum virgatum]